MRRKTIDRCKQAIDLSAEWRCPYAAQPVNSLVHPPYEWMLHWFVKAAQEIVPHAKGTGVTILFENVPFTFLLSADDRMNWLSRSGAMSE
jgi:L-ribulose-5-phosphate 3-epimerase